MEDLHFAATSPRFGLLNPVLQGQLHNLVMTYITVKAATRFQYPTPWLDKKIDNQGVEALPALVDGINYVATFGLGDC
jgi:hypothetical protein